MQVSVILLVILLNSFGCYKRTHANGSFCFVRTRNTPLQAGCGRSENLLETMAAKLLTAGVASYWLGNAFGCTARS
jgi:hypothetical protein